MKVEKIKIEEDYHPYYHHIITKTQKNKIANIPNKTVVLIVIINKRRTTSPSRPI